MVTISAEVPELVIAERQDRISQLKKFNEYLEGALENPIAKVRNRSLRLRGEDPDLHYDGTPSYSGYEAILYAPDGTTRLASTYCNSKGVCERVYDHKTKKFDSQATQSARKSLLNRVREDHKRNLEEIAQAEVGIAAVKDGTYRLKPPNVVRWSARENLAQKVATGEFAFYGRTRRVSVVEVDK